MAQEQINALAASGESETPEFKETTGTLGEAAMTVGAFLNRRGVRVLFVAASSEVRGNNRAKVADGSKNDPLDYSVAGESTLGTLVIEGEPLRPI